jgi:spoIIIJ-associated protein
MPWITKEGRTVEEARASAVEASGLPIDALDVEVVNEGARGLFGLGGEPAVVRVRPKDEATDFRHAFRDDITPALDEDAPLVSAPPRRAVPEPATSSTAGESGTEADGGGAPSSEQQEEAAKLGVEIVRGILDRMDLAGEIKTRIDGGTVYIEVFGDEMGILIGRSGATLESLQEIVRAGVQRRLKTRQAIVVDVESYWERRRRPTRDGGERRGGERRSRGGRGRRRGRGGGNRGGSSEASGA